MTCPPSRAAAAGALALLVGACGSEAPSGGKADPATSAKAAASAAPKVSAPSQADYCKKVCERATKCGNDRALATPSLEPDAKAAVEKSAAETTRVCVEACSAEPATDVRLALADRCNQEADCAGFAKCLSDLGSELKK
jgi:hypothetical protein